MRYDIPWPNTPCVMQCGETRENELLSIIDAGGRMWVECIDNKSCYARRHPDLPTLYPACPVFRVRYWTNAQWAYCIVGTVVAYIVAGLIIYYLLYLHG